MTIHPAKIALSALLVGTFSQATLAEETVLVETSLNQRLHPSATEIFSTRVDLDGPHKISAVGLLTDWWQKRPTEVRVYDNSTGTKGRMIGFGYFPVYFKNVCGENYTSTCSYPENPVGRLVVRTRGKVSSVIVEAHGLLSPDNGYALFSGVQILQDVRSAHSINHAEDADRQNDTALATIAVLEDKEFLNQLDNSFINSIKVGFNSSYSHYLIDVNYQLMDSPIRKCVRSEVEYSPFPGEEPKHPNLVGDC